MLRGISPKLVLSLQLKWPPVFPLCCFHLYQHHGKNVPQLVHWPKRMKDTGNRTTLAEFSLAQPAPWKPRNAWHRQLLPVIRHWARVAVCYTALLQQQPAEASPSFLAWKIGIVIVPLFGLVGESKWDRACEVLTNRPIPKNQLVLPCSHHCWGQELMCLTFIYVHSRFPTCKWEEMRLTWETFQESKKYRINMKLHHFFFFL